MHVTPFAAATSRLNQAVVHRLSNVQALVDGYSVRGIFENPSSEVMQGIVGAEPMLQIMASSAPRVKQGSVVRIPWCNSVLRYVVREVLPDSGGMDRLVLESAT